MDFSNQARWDRAARIFVGAVMVWVGWFGLGDGLLGAACKIFGLIPLVTGLLGWCPFYAVLGIDSKGLRRGRRS